MQCPFCKLEIQDGATKCNHCHSAIGAPAGQVVAPVAASAGDFGALFNGALNLWKANLGDLAVMTLVFMLVVWIPIANIGFITGYTRSILKVARGQGKPQVGDIFNAWDCFGNLLVYLIVLIVASMILSIVPILGTLASMALGFAAMPGMYAIIDGKCGIVDGAKWGLGSIQANLTDWLLAYVVGYVISMAGLVLLLVGVILSAPLGGLITAMQYDRVKPA